MLTNTINSKIINIYMLTGEKIFLKKFSKVTRKMLRFKYYIINGCIAPERKEFPNMETNEIKDFEVLSPDPADFIEDNDEVIRQTPRKKLRILTSLSRRKELKIIT